jgi:long-chain acyl-CoA synthetase
MTAILPSDTIPSVFFRQAQLLANQPLFLANQPDGHWSPIYWARARSIVEALAAFLLKEQIASGDRVLILSENRPEWGLADVAIQSIGAWSVPLYPSLRQEDILGIARDCQAAACIVSSDEQMAKIASIRDKLPGLRLIIALDSINSSGVVSWTGALESGVRLKEQAARTLELRWQALRPDDAATLIYTSGTTGEPKGVMLSHRNFLSNVIACQSVIPLGGEDLHLSFLPLSHIFERMAGWYLMLASGTTIAYARNMETVADDMRAVRPTLMLGVPRFFEKLHARIIEHLQAQPSGKRRLITQAIEIGRAHAACKLSGKRVPIILSGQHALARGLVFRKLQASLGGRLRFCVSGGAPLSQALGEFFYSIGLTIIEGYGLTETSPVITVNRLSAPRFGTVGKPVPGVEVRIADDGEVLSRGPHIMLGYYGKPDLTAEVIRDGWFHTGDIGHIDDQGCLCITDRKKDLIKTAGGKFVAPQKLEGLFCSDPRISQAFVYGDKRPFCVALVVPSRTAVLVFASENRMAGKSFEELVQDPKVREFYWSLIQSKQANLASFEQIKKIALLTQEFSLAAGELTPTLKARRKQISDRYASVLDDLYATPSAPPGAA